MLPATDPPGADTGGSKVPAASVLPPDHQLGMEVPKGGSMCANCEYLKDPQTCGNQGFATWNGSPQLPSPADQYCCDLYEPGQQQSDQNSNMIKALQSPTMGRDRSPLNASAPGQLDEGH